MKSIIKTTLAAIFAGSVGFISVYSYKSMLQKPDVDMLLKDRSVDFLGDDVRCGMPPLLPAVKNWKKFTPQPMEREVARIKNEYDLFFSDAPVEELILKLTKQNPDILKHDPKSQKITVKWLDGERKIHRKGAPAWFEYDYKKKSLKVFWLRNGNSYRDNDLENYVFINDHKLILLWFKEAKLHRLGNKPAEIRYDKKLNEIRMEWSINGGDDRIDQGPNVVVIDHESGVRVMEEWARRPAKYNESRVIHRHDGLHIRQRDPEYNTLIFEQWMDHGMYSHPAGRICKIFRDKITESIIKTEESLNDWKIPLQKQTLCPKILR